MRRAVLVMGVMVAALGAVTGCATSSERGTATYVGPSVRPTTPDPTPTPAAPQKIKTAVPYLPSNFNPYTSTGAQASTLDIVSMLLPSTFVQQPSGGFQLNSDLLQDASVHSDNGHQSVEYKISDDAKWSDGKPITADDFKYLWKQVDKTHTTTLGGYDRISDISQKDSDPHDVVVKFDKPFAEWQSLFDPLVPAHYLREKGWDKGFQSNVPVSAGPFTVQSATQSNMVLARDERYFGDLANLQELSIQVVPTEALAGAVEAGEVDVALNTDSTARPPSSLPDVDAEQVGAPFFDQLVLNTADGPMKSLAVRRAVAYAMDRSQLQAVAGSGGGAPKIAGNRLLLPGTPGYQDRSDTTPYDLARAKQAMQSAGYTYAGTAAMKGGNPLQLRLVTSTTDPRSTQLAQVVQSQLSKVGIGAHISQIPPNVFFQNALPQGEFDVAVTGYETTAQPAVDAEYTYDCSEPGNYTRYCDHTIDDLIAQAIAAKDTAQAADLLNHVDVRLWSAMPTVPLVQRQYQLLAAKKLTGVQYNSAGDSLYWNAASWKVR